MARNGRQGGSVADAPGPEALDAIEKETIEKANKAISAIENALAVWDSAKDKPQELEQDMARYRLLHAALSDWMRKMLLSAGRKRDEEERKRMLAEFISITLKYG